MPSQTDLDQGGTTRQWVKTYLGPSVGWINTPLRNVLGVTIPGTYNLDLSTTLVQVKVAGPVTIILPSALNSGLVAGANPGPFVKAPITIVDVGGNAAAHPITIEPINAAETIMGLASIQITSNFGGFILEPSQQAAGWVNAQ
jgi:hypothetical protein